MAKLIYGTNFENITKTNNTHLSIPISHEFGLGDIAGGARIWMEDGAQTSNSPTPHSGTRCLGMEATISGRNEFNIYNIQSLTTTGEYFVSEWMYLPVGWTVPATHWYAICNPFQGTYSPYLPVSEIHPNNWDNVNKTSLDYGFKGALNLGHWFNLPPVGEWFKFEYYVKLSTTAGIIKVWINNEEILGASGIDTWGAVGRAMLTTVAKIYGSEGVGTWRLWVDDLEIWDGEKKTTVLSKCPVCGTKLSISLTRA